MKLQDRRPQGRGRLRLVVTVLGVGVLAGGPLCATAPDPVREYRVSGDMDATVVGPHCCGASTHFTGRFEARYNIDSTGAARVTGLSFQLDDRLVIVRGGFLDLFAEEIQASCTSGSLSVSAAGFMDTAETLRLPAGSLQIDGGFAEGRNPDGACVDHGIDFSGSNSGSAYFLHKPDSDHVELHADLAATLEDGAGYTLHLDGAGHFDNRPPVARLVFRYPDGTYAQTGCPTVSRVQHGQVWEDVADANSPAGLTGFLFSNAVDPDGAWPRADIFTDRWIDERGTGTLSYLGDGRDVGPLTFDGDSTHTLRLVAYDHTGAAAATQCPEFRVGDLTPPAVSAPPPLLTTCSTTGGATAATSPAIASFLASATATDVVTPAPAALPAQAGGADVTTTTLFPTNVARNVTFRFTDGAGLVGTATSSVTVVDNVPPSVGLAVDRPQLPPDFRFWTVNVAATLSDACGGALSLRLLSLTSNAPAFDASDIAGIAPGTDDRSFQLFARAAGPGIDRVYTARYEAKDPAGNVQLTEARITVLASDISLGDTFASFDAALLAPRCTAFGRSCDSGPLLMGRRTLGPEPHQPNTIHDSCADGASGTFHADESSDRLKVSTIDGTPLAAGRTARVEAVVWAFAAFASDHLDLYYSANAGTPTWTYITTLTPTAAGRQTLSATYVLPAGPLQAVRARFRYNGSPSPCAAGSFDDHDDVVFPVR